MTHQPIRVGIIGVQPGESWAGRAHIPALRSLEKDYEIVAIANSTIESSRRAAEPLGVRPHANAIDLVADPDIDLVVVTVRVPYHFEIVKAAIVAGKHVYCEWPLGNGLAEGEELAALARAKGVLGVVGTQACFAPEVQHLKQLIKEGYIGDVLSTTVIGRGGRWGGTIPNEAGFAYLLDNANGATMLTIPLGHTLAAVTAAMGEIGHLSAELATRRKEVVALDTGRRLPATAPDQVLVSGVLASGAPISIHYRGGDAREGATGFLWEINGSAGDLQISALSGHIQMVSLTLSGAQGETPIRPIAIPPSLTDSCLQDPVSRNVARIYAQLAADLRDGTRVAPTFDDAVAIHRIIAAIESAAADGKRSKPVPHIAT